MRRQDQGFTTAVRGPRKELGVSILADERFIICVENTLDTNQKIIVNDVVLNPVIVYGSITYEARLHLLLDTTRGPYACTFQIVGWFRKICYHDRAFSRIAV